MESWVGVKRDVPVLKNKNCVVHISNLPVTIDYGTLFSALRNTGKINRVTIAGSEAFVQFWSRDGVTRLLQKQRDGLFIIGTQIPRVKVSNVAMEGARRPSLQSRILTINGPQEIINYEYLKNFFSERFEYNIESVEITDVHSDIRSMRWSFASYNTQCRKAWSLIGEEKRKANESSVYSHWKDVWFNFESDPCQPYQTIVPFPRRIPPPRMHPLPYVGQLYHEDHPPFPFYASWDYGSDTCIEDEEENKSESPDGSLGLNVSSSSSDSDPNRHYRITTDAVSLPPQTPPRIQDLFQNHRNSC